MARRLKSLKSTDGFATYVVDQLSEIGDVTSRAMFGGVGLYCDGLFFGIIAADVLYLKVDDSNRGQFERAGSKPFMPYADRKPRRAARSEPPTAMEYYAVPVGVLESGFDLAEWAKKSVAVAAAKGRRRVTRRSSAR